MQTPKLHLGTLALTSFLGLGASACDDGDDNSSFTTGLSSGGVTAGGSAGGTEGDTGGSDGGTGEGGSTGDATGGDGSTGEGSSTGVEPDRPTDPNFYGPCEPGAMGPMPRDCPMAADTCYADGAASPPWGVCAMRCEDEFDCAGTDAAAIPECTASADGSKFCALDCVGDFECPPPMVCRDISGGNGSMACVHTF